MVALPRLEDYTPGDLARAEALSPAIARYRRLLETDNLDSLRRRRHRAWVEGALATLLGRADAATVCACWSDAADAVLTEAWRDAGLIGRSALLVAMGKLGARELNLSSDVDLMVVAEPIDLEFATRAVRSIQSRLADGEAGLGFRLDFDLRPGGARGPLVVTPSQFQDHYWSQGETWERLALVRLRPLVGPPSLRAQIDDLAGRFSYRKYLDFTLLDDLRQLRASVHQRGFVRRTGELHLKLEVGGIRDVELFVHAQQVLRGGKLPRLRTTSTSGALAVLAELGILTEPTAQALSTGYWRLREIENRVQAVDDRQTHLLAESDPRAAEARSTMREVNQLVSSLLGEARPEVTSLPLGPTEQRAWLNQLGFDEETITSTWPRLFRATALSQKNERDERARRDFLFAFVGALATTPGLDRDLGLTILADFVRATRAKANVFSTLLRVPRLIDDLARVFAISPYLGATLAARPELLDHLILPVATPWSDDPATLLDQMAERRQLTELWAATHLLGHGDTVDLFARISATADDVAAQMLRQLRNEFSDARVRVVTLGKWGGRELGLRSDLDFIFVSDHPPGPHEFRLARRFVTRMTDPGKSGALYEVDLRLRPSGQAGPLMVTADRLKSYWRNEAAPWERQAYLRARSLEGEIDRADLSQRPLTSEDLAELRRIRLKLLRPADDGRFDLKFAPGGLIDIEFVAQTALLARGWTSAPTSTLGMIEFLAEHDAAWSIPELKSAYAELRLIEQHLQLASFHRLGALSPSDPVLARVAVALDQEPQALWDKLRALTARTRTYLNHLDPTGITF